MTDLHLRKYRDDQYTPCHALDESSTIGLVHRDLEVWIPQQVRGHDDIVGLRSGATLLTL